MDDAAFDPPVLTVIVSGFCLSTAICGTRQMESEFVAVTEAGLADIDPAKVGP